MLRVAYDANYWLGGSPLLFDRSCQPKEAFLEAAMTARKSRQK